MCGLSLTQPDVASGRWWVRSSSPCRQSRATAGPQTLVRLFPRNGSLVGLKVDISLSSPSLQSHRMASYSKGGRRRTRSEAGAATASGATRKVGPVRTRSRLAFSALVESLSHPRSSSWFICSIPATLHVRVLLFCSSQHNVKRSARWQPRGPRRVGRRETRQKNSALRLEETNTKLILLLTTIAVLLRP